MPTGQAWPRVLVFSLIALTICATFAAWRRPFRYGADTIEGRATVAAQATVLMDRRLDDPMTGFIPQESIRGPVLGTPIATMAPIEPPTGTLPPWTSSSRSSNPTP